VSGLERCLLKRRMVVEGVGGLPILDSVVEHREVLFPQVSYDLGACQFLERSKTSQGRKCFIPCRMRNNELGRSC